MADAFALLEMLGMGGFAQTWRARVLDPTLVAEWGTDVVALKIPLSKQKERVLHKELEIIGSLHLQLTRRESANIVKYYGFEVFQGGLVMVMEYVSGGNLRDYIQRHGQDGRLPVAAALPIMRGILSGLEAIHRKRVIHRDIKPLNILMDGDTPKIADLGIARMLRPDELASTAVGTLFYISPELLLGKPATFNTDIWSLGVSFYEMVCGCYPFGIDPAMPPGLLVKLIGGEGVRLMFPPGIALPEPVTTMLHGALQRDPRQRFKTAAEMARVLPPEEAGSPPAEEEPTPDTLRAMLSDPLRAAEALPLLQRLVERQPRQAEWHLLLGEYCNYRGESESALAVFRRGVECCPDHARLQWNLAVTLQQRGAWAEARRVLERALALGLEPALLPQARRMLRVVQKKESEA